MTVTGYEACRARPYAGAVAYRQCWREPGHEPPHRDAAGAEWTDDRPATEGARE